MLHTPDAYLQLFVATIAFVLGLLLLLRPRAYMKSMRRGKLFSTEGLHPDTARRLGDALNQRRALEESFAPPKVGYLGGALCIAIAAISVFGHLSFIWTWTLLILVQSSLLYAAYTTVRIPGKRVAELTGRKPPLPDAIYIVAATSTLLAFLLVRQPGLGLATVFVWITAALNVYFAWSLRYAPAVITTHDPGAEQVIDTRLRSARSFAFLYLALLPVWTLFIHGSRSQPDQIATTIGEGATLAAMALVFFFGLRSLRTPLGSELDRMFDQ